jgi:type IV secretory pathway TraG/TraD family ATPase VirD4
MKKPHRIGVEKKVPSMYEEQLIKAYGKEKAQKILKGANVMFTVKETKNVKKYKGVSTKFN